MPSWLVVEDELDVNDVIVAMWHIWGVDGLAFSNGLDALDWLAELETGHSKRRSELPALALLDIRLPGVSGIEVAQRFRKSTHLTNLAIVFMTAYRLSPSQERALIERTAAEAVIYKPLPSMIEFKAQLDGALAQRLFGTPA